jgi:alpha-L-fucosidase
VRTATLDIDLGSARTFNVVRLQEPIQLGQRIRAYRVEAEVGGTWQVLSEGTTIGYRKLDRFDTVTAGRIRVTVLDTRAAPIVSGFGVYHDPRW